MNKLFSILIIATIINGCSSQKAGTSTNNTTSPTATTNTTPVTSTSMNTLTAKERTDGWELLFDGSSTNGWHTYGYNSVMKGWVVKDGSLSLDVNDRKDVEVPGSKDILTDKEFENYHFKTDWKMSPKGNSGIIFNIHEDKAKYPATYQTGPEMQVLDNDGHPDGKIIKHRAGDLYDLISSSSEPVKPVGEWNTAEIMLNKGKLGFYLNGVHIINTSMGDDNWNKMVAGSKFKSMTGFGTFKSGKIALQEHGHDVWFRNIKIRRL
jgi:hypothetical protein